MFQKRTILIASVFMLLTASFIVTNGQVSDDNVVGVLFDDSSPDLIAVSPTELFFVGKQGGGLIERTITVVGLAEDPVTVDIILGELYANSSGTTASLGPLEPEQFVEPILMADVRSVKFTLNSSKFGAETYYGEILITATANKTVTTTINVTAKITSEPGPLPTDDQWKILGVIFLLVFSAFVVMRKHEEIPVHKSVHKWKIDWKIDRSIIAIPITVLAVFVWFSSLISAKFELQVSDIVTTGLITALVSHAFSYVKENRDRKNTNIKSATDIQNKGIEKDVEMLQNILGETTTHYASFNFGFEGIDPTEIPKHPKILFNEQGKLSTSTWEKYHKQGSISDLPLLYLEKYYDFIKLYNRYYSCAITMTKDTNFKEFENLKKNDPNIGTFFKKFNNFRKKYEDLETVLFVYMSYFLGLFGQTRLAPIKIAYPRITRVLLKKLTDYDILKAKDYPVNEKVLKKDHKFDLFRRKLKKSIPVKIKEKLEEKFEEEYKENIGKKREELQRKFKNKATQDKKYQAWFDTEFDGWKNSEAAQNVTKEVIEKERLKVKIELWDLTAEQIDEILKDIYNKEDMRTFYYEIGQDFRKKYKALLDAIADLPPLPPKCLEKEQIPLILKDHVLNKKLLEELGKLKELKDKGAITKDQFEAKKAKILENMKYLNTKHKKFGLLEELKQLKILLDLGTITKNYYKKRKKEIEKALKEIDAGLPPPTPSPS